MPRLNVLNRIKCSPVNNSSIDGSKQNSQATGDIDELIICMKQEIVKINLLLINQLTNSVEPNMNKCVALATEIRVKDDVTKRLTLLKMKEPK